MEYKNVSWKRIVVFFVIATVVSNIFRFDVFEIKAELEELPTWIFVLVSVLLEGSGVLIGAVIAVTLLKKTRSTQISIFGTSKSKGILMAAIPVVLLVAIGVNNEFEMNAHLYGLIAIIGTLIYCLMEEFGWRGYLQEELRFLTPWPKYLIIGLVWYLWHLTFLTEASVGDNLFFIAMMIFGSWGIGQVAESTKSILASACFHLIIQIMMFNALIKNGIDRTEKLIILGVSVVLWFAIVKKWEMQNARVKADSE
ncbi:MAG: CPBP family intramembrane metalloprotease [Cyclobacteriaceae bacterium]|nr:CPBP family intramembrane metalloprotease [Cyclobacteriaceae bacterium]